MDVGVVLAAGKGTRIWPYSVVRPKAMVPVANVPLIDYGVNALKSAGCRRVLIAAGDLSERITNYYRRDEVVQVARVTGSSGTADSLAQLLPEAGDAGVLVVYGDTILDPADLKGLADLFEREGNAALVDPLAGESSRDWVCCSVSGGKVERILGHPRDSVTHRFAAFALGKEIYPYIRRNAGIFTNVQVGMMPPVESYLEMSLADWMSDGGSISACETRGRFLDVDKPWQLLEANERIAVDLCRSLAGNELSEGSSIDDSADIEGFVRLGKGSRIGRNVRIRGNVTVGDGSVVDNGAIIDGDTFIGSGCLVANYCMIDAGSVIGDRCVVNHCAELSGVIMDNVYLYHYMEFYGVLGSNTDLGAATVCGTLRFDDGATAHRVKGRLELPRSHSNASYLGDYVRTGVNAIIMPGCKVGAYSIVGPGVVLNEDLADRTRVMVKQDLERRPWGPERYGW